MSTTTHETLLSRLGAALRLYFHTATPDGERDAANTAVQRMRARLLAEGVPGLTIEHFIEHVRLGGTAADFGRRKAAGGATPGAKARQQNARKGAPKARASGAKKPGPDPDAAREHTSYRARADESWHFDLCVRLSASYGVALVPDAIGERTGSFLVEGPKAAVRAYRAAEAAAVKRVADRIEEVIATAEVEGRKWRKSR